MARPGGFSLALQRLDIGYSAPSSARPSTGGRQREQDLSISSSLSVAVTGRQHSAPGQIPADRFSIEPELGGDPHLR